jgi:hypothetical protein
MVVEIASVHVGDAVTHRATAYIDDRGGYTSGVYDPAWSCRCRDMDRRFAEFDFDAVLRIPDDDVVVVYESHRTIAPYLSVSIRNATVVASESRYNFVSNEWNRRGVRCLLCKTASVRVAFVPCGHAFTCESCAGSVKACNVCGVEAVSLVYLNKK